MSKVSGFCFALLLLSGVAQAKARDPFIPMAGEGAPSLHRPVATSKNGPATAPRPVAQAPTRKEAQWVAPVVQMQGLVLSPTGNKAILKSEKRTYVVAVGDRLGDFKVARVQRNGVTLTQKDHSFEVKLAH